MHSSDTDPGGPEGPQSELPSVLARVIAFASILIGGVAGGLIGYAFAELGGFDGAAKGAVAVVSAIVGAGGVAVVAVLTLRAFGEWDTIRSSERGSGPGQRRSGPIRDRSA